MAAQAGQLEPPEAASRPSAAAGGAGASSSRAATSSSSSSGSGSSSGGLGGGGGRGRRPQLDLQLHRLVLLHHDGPGDRPVAVLGQAHLVDPELEPAGQRRDPVQPLLIGADPHDGLGRDRTDLDLAAAGAQLDLEDLDRRRGVGGVLRVRGLVHVADQVLDGPRQVPLLLVAAAQVVEVLRLGISGVSELERCDGVVPLLLDVGLASHAVEALGGLAAGRLGPRLAGIRGARCQGERDDPASCT